MSLMDNLPHLATAKIRTRTRDDLGGSKDSWTTVFTDRACWQQPASATDIMLYQKREINVTYKIYFASDPGLNETHIVEIGGVKFDVVSVADPDASAGLGVLYRVMANKFSD